MTTPQLDVRYVANLARIDLSEEEVQQFQEQLGRVLEHVEQLSTLDVSGVDPTAHANPIYNVFREDAPRESLAKAKALSNAPAQTNGLVSVTKVIE